jgi:uncharacterized damage-inducible protein DinB
MADHTELLERFRRGPEVLAVAMTGVFGEEEDWVAEPREWSIRQIIAHLADSELVFAHRFRQVIAEDNPTLVAFDQDAWAARLDYARRAPKQSLETLRRLRAENHALLGGVAAGDFGRTGNHTEKGPMPLRELVERAARHVESHAGQIERLRAAYQAAKGKR